MEAADAIVSLTAAGVRAIPELGYRVRPEVHVEVIPTCVDLTRFAPGHKDPELVAAFGLADSVVIGCVGTMSNWYMRDDMLRYLARLASSFERLRVLIVTREDHDCLRRDAEAAGIPANQLVVTKADFTEMPRFTRLFDAGLFFIRPSFSKRGSAATKLAEFLACAVPVIINDGVGDSGDVVKERGVGVVLPDVREESFSRSLPQVKSLLTDPRTGDRCRRVATEQFDLDRGVARYGELYRLLSRSS